MHYDGSERETAASWRRSGKAVDARPTQGGSLSVGGASSHAALATLIGNRAYGRLLQRQSPGSLVNNIDLLGRLDLRTLLELATSDDDYRLGSALFTREWLDRERDVVEESVLAKLRDVVRLNFFPALKAEDAVLAIRDLDPIVPRMLRLIAHHVAAHPDQWRQALGRLSRERGSHRTFPRLYVHLTAQLERRVWRDMPRGPGETPGETYPVWDLHLDGQPEVVSVDVRPHPHRSEVLDVEYEWWPWPGATSVERFTFPTEIPLGGRRTPPPPPPPVPIPAPAPRRVTVPAEVLFRFDKAEIRPEAAETLLKHLGNQPSHADPSRPVEVRGHTDAIGDIEYNQRLSERRANAVKAFLEEHYPHLRGRVHAVGLGETHPVAPNTVDGRDNPTGRAKNRRVEIDLTMLEPL
jgi:outer membrane protein OmpA-like peptidoglycan-associated protein